MTQKDEVYRLSAHRRRMGAGPQGRWRDKTELYAWEQRKRATLKGGGE